MINYQVVRLRIEQATSLTARWPIIQRSTPEFGKLVRDGFPLTWTLLFCRRPRFYRRAAVRADARVVGVVRSEARTVNGLPVLAAIDDIVGLDSHHAGHSQITFCLVAVSRFVCLPYLLLNTRRHWFFSRIQSGGWQRIVRTASASPLTELRNIYNNQVILANILLFVNLIYAREPLYWLSFVVGDAGHSANFIADMIENYRENFDSFIMFACSSLSNERDPTRPRGSPFRCTLGNEQSSPSPA